MRHKIAAVLTYDGNPKLIDTVNSLRHSELVNGILAVKVGQGELDVDATIEADTLWSSGLITKIINWFESTQASHLLWVFGGAPTIMAFELSRLSILATDTQSVLTYSDYYELDDQEKVGLHPLIDYQLGSARDDFDFGPLILLERLALSDLKKTISNQSFTYGGFYDLRLRLAERGRFLHIKEPCYRLPTTPDNIGAASHFSYVDPKNRVYQLEMEEIFTRHLKAIGAHIVSPKQDPLKSDERFPVLASVVIPVRNRVKTVAAAIKSALAQQTTFDYNIIVVDNHSTDGTSELIEELISENPRVVHLIPAREDLIIGGCWNEAIYSHRCGKYAVQLDSDDLYSDRDVLARIVAEFEKGLYAMIIGSYTIVDFDLNTLPPGLIDHREWTPENGHNNALRIAGLGAPRAFHVPTLRQFGFPNVGYGEDYAIALRLTRSYAIGRIYESLYLCRRWGDNTDSYIDIKTKNRYALYKDNLRTIEILARQNLAKV